MWPAYYLQENIAVCKHCCCDNMIKFLCFFFFVSDRQDVATPYCCPLLLIINAPFGSCLNRWVCPSLSLNYWIQLSCCLNALRDKNQNVVFGLHVTSTFRLDAHEHAEVGRKTSQIGKWGPPRSTSVKYRKKWFLVFGLIHHNYTCEKQSTAWQHT